MNRLASIQTLASLASVLDKQGLYAEASALDGIAVRMASIEDEGGLADPEGMPVSPAIMNHIDTLDKAMNFGGLDYGRDLSTDSPLFLDYDEALDEAADAVLEMADHDFADPRAAVVKHEHGYAVMPLSMAEGKHILEIVTIPMAANRFEESK